MSREADPSYLEWVRLKGSSAKSAGQDVVDLASSLIDSLYEKLSAAEASLSASQRSFDQKVHRLELQAQTHQQATQNALHELTQSQNQCQSLQESANACRAQIAQLTTSRSELEDRLAAANRAQELTEARLRDQLPLQERRASQMASQTEQLRALKDELQKMTQDKLRLETQVTNMQSSSLTLNYELSLAKTENESLRRQLEQLHSETREKSATWREEKASMAREKHDLERQLQSAQDELTSAQAQASFSTRALEDKEKLVKKLQSQVDSLNVGQKAFSETSKNSQFAQLAELYKSKFEESDASRERLRTELSKKSEELQVQVEETRKLKELVSTLENDVRDAQIQVANLSEGKGYDNLILSKDKFLALLQQFVHQETHVKPSKQNGAADAINLDSDEENSDAISSTHLNTDHTEASALEIAKLLEKAAASDNFQQLIALQQKYEIATSQLVKQRAETRNLEEYFVRIEAEMGRVMPTLEEKQRQHELALVEVAATKEELANVTRILQQRESENALSQRKIASLQQQVQQTSAQVQTMLFQAQNGPSVVSMADIESLHNRNVELEILTRDLHSTVEILQHERDQKSAELEQLNLRYQQMETTIASLEAAFSTQDAVHQLTNKRRSTSTNFLPSPTRHDTDTAMEAVDVISDDETIDPQPAASAQDISNSPKYQHALFQIEELQKHTREITMERDTWRDSTGRLQNTLSLKEADLERAQSRLSSLQTTHAIHEEQIEDLRRKLTRQNAIVEKYENEVAELSSARNSSALQATQAQQMAEVSKLQVQLLKEQVEQVSLALAQAREQWQTQQAHLRDATALHAKQEAHWSELSTKQDARIAQLQSALEDTNQDAESKLHNAQETLSSLRAELASTSSKVSHLEEIIVLKDQSLNQLKELLDEQKSVMETLKRTAGRTSTLPVPPPAPVAPAAPSQHSEELSNLKKQYDDKMEELRIANEHLTNSKQLLTQSEARLTQLQGQYNTLKDESQSTLAEYEADIAQLQETLKTQSENVKTLSEELEALKTSHAEEMAAHNELKVNFNSREAEITQLRTQTSEFKKDAQIHEETLKSTRANYQHATHELSTTLNQLADLQKRVEKISAERDGLLLKLENAQQTQIAQKAQHEAKLASQAAEVNLLQQRIQDGITNATSMTTEIAALKSQVNYWKSIGGSSAAASSGLTSAAVDLEASSQLNLALHAEGSDAGSALEPESADEKTLKWVKREYEITLTQLSLSRQEASEQRAQIQVLRDNLERLTHEIKTLRDETSLPGEQQGGATSLLSLQHQHIYEKLQAQTEQLNLLRESNMVLRQQKKDEETLRREVEAKLIQVEADKETSQSLATRLTHDKNTLAESVKHLTQQNEQWKGRVQELLTKYKDIETHAAQEAKIEALQDEIATTSHDRDELKQRLDAIEAQQAADSSQKAAQSAQSSKLQGEVAQLRATHKQTQEQLKKANETIEQLTLESKEYQEQLEEYIEDLEKKQQELTTLKTDLDQTRAELQTAKSASVVAQASTAPAVATPTVAPPAPAAKQAAAKVVTAVPSAPSVTPASPAKATALVTPAAPKAPSAATTLLPPASAAKATPPPPNAVSKLPPPPLKSTAAVPAAASPTTPATSTTSSEETNTLKAHLSQLENRLSALDNAKQAKLAEQELLAQEEAARKAQQLKEQEEKRKLEERKRKQAEFEAKQREQAEAKAREEAKRKAEAEEAKKREESQAAMQTDEPVLESEAPVNPENIAQPEVVPSAAPETAPKAPSTAARKLPPPPPKANAGKRTYAEMADAPAYVPSASPITPPPVQAEAAASETVTEPSTPAVATQAPSSPAQPSAVVASIHTEAPPPKRPKLDAPLRVERPPIREVEDIESLLPPEEEEAVEAPKEPAAPEQEPQPQEPEESEIAPSNVVVSSPLDASSAPQETTAMDVSQPPSHAASIPTTPGPDTAENGQVEENLEEEPEPDTAGHDSSEHMSVDEQGAMEHTEDQEEQPSAMEEAAEAEEENAEGIEEAPASEGGEEQPIEPQEPEIPVEETSEMDQDAAAEAPTAETTEENGGQEELEAPEDDPHQMDATEPAEEEEAHHQPTDHQEPFEGEDATWENV